MQDLKKESTEEFDQKYHTDDETGCLESPRVTSRVATQKKGLKKYFEKDFYLLKTVEDEHKDRDFSGWKPECVDEYMSVIKEELRFIRDNENEIHVRSGSLLALNGIILALIVSFTDHGIIASSLVKFFIITSVLSFLLSAFFMFWSMRPSRRQQISYLSHETDYCRSRKDEKAIRSRILNDLVISIETLDEVYRKKVNRFEVGLHFAMFGLITIVVAIIAQF